MRIYTAPCGKISGPKIPVRIRFRQKAVRMEADGKSVNANDVLRAEMEAYKRGDMSALAMHALTNYDSSADYWKLMEDGSLAYDGDGWLKDSARKSNQREIKDYEKNAAAFL